MDAVVARTRHDGISDNDDEQRLDYEESQTWASPIGVTDFIGEKTLKLSPLLGDGSKSSMENDTSVGSSKAESYYSRVKGGYTSEESSSLLWASDDGGAMPHTLLWTEDEEDDAADDDSLVFSNVFANDGWQDNEKEEEKKGSKVLERLPLTSSALERFSSSQELKPDICFGDVVRNELFVAKTAQEKRRREWSSRSLLGESTDGSAHGSAYSSALDLRETEQTNSGFNSNTMMMMMTPRRHSIAVASSTTTTSIAAQTPARRRRSSFKTVPSVQRTNSTKTVMTNTTTTTSAAISPSRRNHSRRRKSHHKKKKQQQQPQEEEEDEIVRLEYQQVQDEEQEQQQEREEEEGRGEDKARHCRRKKGRKKQRGKSVDPDKMEKRKAIRKHRKKLLECASFTFRRKDNTDGTLRQTTVEASVSKKDSETMCELMNRTLDSFASSLLYNNDDQEQKEGHQSKDLVFVLAQIHRVSYTREELGRMKASDILHLTSKRPVLIDIETDTDESSSK